MKKILIPIDFSENSQNAIQSAKAIALKTGAELAILHTYQPNIVNIAMPVTESTEPLYNDLENSYKQQLEEYVAGAQAEGFKVKGIWESTRVHSAILHRALEINADLIVTGRTGQGSFIDKLIGSSATGIALQARCPVLVVPPQVGPLEFNHFVYATQLEYEEMDILHQVKNLADQLGARLSFIKISSLEQPNIQPDQQYVQQIVKELGIRTSDIIIQKTAGVIEGIKNYCDQIKADMLIIATRKRGFLEQFITNPSIAKELVMDTHVPLLIYHIK